MFIENLVDFSHNLWTFAWSMALIFISFAVIKALVDAFILDKLYKLCKYLGITKSQKDTK